MSDFDCIVIGAGVVGLAVARDAAAVGLSTLVLERHGKFGTETSSRNSEVVHSGLYYRPGSLKATTCAAGRVLLEAYCAAREIELRRCGKLVVAVDDAEIPVLRALEEQAAANDVPNVRLIDRDAVRALEPEVRAVAALSVPVAGVIDSHALMTALVADIEARGGLLAFRAAVSSARRQPTGFEVVLEDGTSVCARRLVNAAGLTAPALARCIEGIGTAPDPHFAKGSYFEYRGRAPFQRLIYPVPVDGGLGIHATLDLAGRVRFGPDVEWQSRPDYVVDCGRGARFEAAIRRYWPALPGNALVPGYAGVRPKLAPPGSGFVDFRIDGSREHGVPGLVCLYGIESPGLTAALALGARVRELLEAA